MKKLLLPLAAMCCIQATAQTTIIKDNSFGNNGSVLLAPSVNQIDLQNHFLTSDNKILFGGMVHGSNKNLFAVKTDINGTIDAIFGNGGIALYDPQIGAPEEGGYITKRPDGKLMIVGCTKNSQNFDVLAICLNADGTIDQTFGNGGVNIMPIAGDDRAVKVVVKNNKIYIGGASSINGDFTDAFIIRLNMNGSLDQTFGSIGGIELIDYKSGEESMVDFDVLSDGSVIAIGRTRSSTSKQYVCKLTPQGKLDKSFGVNGFFIHTEPTGTVSFKKLAIGTSNEVYVAGYFQNANLDVAAVWKVEANGVLSNSFGSGTGRAVFNINPPSIQRFGGLALRNNGDIFLVGNYKDNIHIESYPMTAVVRADGSFNTDFYGTGYKIDSLPSGQMFALLMTATNSIGGDIYVSGMCVDSFSNIKVIINKYVETPLSVQATDKKEEIVHLYPNPATHQISINTQSGKAISEISLYNLQGALLKKLDDKGNHQYSLPSGLSHGLYVVGIKTNDGQTISKTVYINQ